MQCYFKLKDLSLTEYNMEIYIQQVSWLADKISRVSSSMSKNIKIHK